MKRIKEIQPLLTAIYCYNHINANNDNIALLSEYGLHELCDANSNMIKLIACSGNKQDLINYINKFLTENTKYNDFIKLKEYYKNDGKWT